MARQFAQMGQLRAAGDTVVPHRQVHHQRRQPDGGGRPRVGFVVQRVAQRVVRGQQGWVHHVAGVSLGRGWRRARAAPQGGALALAIMSQ